MEEIYVQPKTPPWHPRTKQHIDWQTGCEVMAIFVNVKNICYRYRPSQFKFSVKSAFMAVKRTQYHDYFRLPPTLREHQNRYKAHLFFINFISHHYFSILQCYVNHFDADLNPH